MIEEQGGRCKICKKVLRIGGKEKDSCHIDHDHKKQRGELGFIRGLLCMGCNVGLGAFGENAQVLADAQAYLEMHT